MKSKVKCFGFIYLQFVTKVLYNTSYRLYDTSFRLYNIFSMSHANVT